MKNFDLQLFTGGRSALIRNMIADYLEVNGKMELCGIGFTKLDESPGAQSDNTTYINETTSSADIIGYETEFPYEFDAVVIERMKKMNIEINGVTLQADFMDADFMEVFEPAIFTMREGINASKTMQGMVAAKYKAMNQTIETFFDTAFGEGTADSIFQGSKNVMVHLEAVAKIEEAQRAEKKQFNDFSNKYTQRQNSFQSMQGHQKKQRNQPNRT